METSRFTSLMKITMGTMMKDFFQPKRGGKMCMGRIEKSRSLDLGQKGQLGNKLGGTYFSLLQGSDSCILQVHIEDCIVWKRFLFLKLLPSQHAFSISSPYLIRVCLISRIPRVILKQFSSNHALVLGCEMVRNVTAIGGCLEHVSLPDQYKDWLGIGLLYILFLSFSLSTF